MCDRSLTHLVSFYATVGMMVNLNELNVFIICAFATKSIFMSNILTVVKFYI